MQTLLTLMTFEGAQSVPDFKMEEAIILAVSHHLIIYNFAPPEYKLLHKIYIVCKWARVSLGD